MEKLGIDTKLLLAQIINFVLFFFIFKKFIAQPFSQFLQREKEKEKEKERILTDLKKKEADFLAEQKKIREKLKLEREEFIKQAKIEAKKLKNDLVAQAEKDASEIIKRGRAQIEEERQTMEQQIKKRIADLSVLLVEKGLKDFLTLEAQKKITADILKNLMTKTYESRPKN